jgi:flavin reductase (DIM6/NTAB) family NADH-FMN oxidoreductase RutF
MFYDPRDNLRPAPLSHNPFNALVAPRPIGWISSIDNAGNVNLAPFSFFNAFSSDPPLVGFALGSKDAQNTPKDTLYNVRQVPEFVANLASYELREQVNLSSATYPREIDEFEQIGLAQAPSQLVRPPRVAAARAALECSVFQILELPSQPGGRDRHLVIGEVIGIHIDDEVIADGMVDVTRLRPIARLGYEDYAVVDSVFSMQRPK